MVAAVQAADPAAKRALDIILSAIGLVLFAPVLAIVAAWVKRDSPGPIFYEDVRIGRGGRPFKMYKIRTMVVDARNLSHVVSTPSDDPRITRSGRLLRHLNLDELPQLVNVLKGDMSIVGPRPEVPHYVEMFTPEERRILSVRPGLTDWATLWIRDKGKLLAGARDPEQIYLSEIWPEKRRLQLAYVEKRSLRHDTLIILQTIRLQIDRIFNRY